MPYDPAPYDADSPPPPDVNTQGADDPRNAPGGYSDDKPKPSGGGRPGGGPVGGGGGGPPVEPDPNEPNYSADVWDYIHYAASRADSSGSELAGYLRNGSNLNAKASTTGYTPLHVAVKFGQCEGVRQLLAAGAQVDSRDVLDQTPLSLACCYQVNFDIYQQLLRAGANPNYEDGYTWRPLFWAARKGYQDVVKLLLQYGAKKTARDKRWQTPYDVASNSQIKSLLS